MPQFILYQRKYTPIYNVPAQICPKNKKSCTIQCRIFWQGQKGSNPRPTVLETAALPAELNPYVFFDWWAFRDSNPGPSGYEPDALTN